MLEIVKDGVDLFILLEASNKYPILDNYIGYSWNLFLTCGKINDIFDNNYRYVLDRKYVSRQKVKEFYKLIKEYQNIRLWVSKNDTENYLVFLYVMNLLRDEDYDIRVIFCEHSLSHYSYDEIGSLLLNERCLSKYDIKKYALEWDLLEKVNSPVRILNDGIIKSVNWDYFDDSILSTLKSVGPISIGKLLDELVSIYGDEHGHIDDRIYCKRVYDLIDSGRIGVETGRFNVENMYETVICFVIDNV